MKQQLFKKLGYILSKIYATSAKQVEDSLKINAPTLTNYKKWENQGLVVFLKQTKKYLCTSLRPTEN
jgi:hypothetical protein